MTESRGKTFGGRAFEMAKDVAYVVGVEAELSRDAFGHRATGKLLLDPDPLVFLELREFLGERRVFFRHVFIIASSQPRSTAGGMLCQRARAGSAAGAVCRVTSKSKAFAGPPALNVSVDVNRCATSVDDLPLEGKSVTPHVAVDYDPKDLAANKDTVLKHAVSVHLK